MSANTVITSLQQAKNCSGKCDCYANLQNQIHQLGAEIKTIPRINEKAIIEKTEATLFPKIPGLILPMVNVQLNPIKAFQTKQLANQRVLLERVFKAESAARTAGTTANIAKSTATSAAAKAGGVAARVAALAVTVLSLVGVAATIKLLESRSNGIEKQVDSVSADLSKAFGFLFQNRQKIDGNSSAIKKNQQKIADVNDTAYSAQRQATQAREIGQKAQSTANQANQKSDRNFDLIKPLQLGLSAVILQINGILPRLLNVEKTANQSKVTATKTLIEVQKPKIEQNVNKSEVDKILARINQVDQKVAAIPGLVTPILPAVRNLPNSSSFKKSVSGATCSTLNSEGCTRRLRNSIGERIGRGNSRLWNRINTGLNGLNLGASGAQLSYLNTINTKLGPQVPGGLSGTFGRLWQTLQVDRVLNMLTYITTMHNAMMLSNNIGQTLFSAIDNLSQSVGFKWKNEKGAEVGFGSIVGEWTTNFFKGLFGVENYNAMTLAYKKANRIYQAGTNILDSARNMVDSVRNISETVVENTGRIGNSLKRDGVVGDDAFKWMPEKVDGRSRLLQQLENIGEAASTIEQVTGEIASVTQNLNEIQQQAQVFQQSITNSPIKTQTENTAVKTQQSTDKAESESPAIPQSAERNP